MPLNLEEFSAGLSDILERSLTPIWDQIRILRTELDETRSVASQPGPRGEPGPVGPAGQNAEPVARDMVLSALRSEPLIIEEAVVRHLAAHPPAAGRDGAPGEPGEKGERGDPGHPGQQGDRGEIGPPGALGERGLSGEPGPAGRDGRDGIDGKHGDLSISPDDVAEQVAKAISLISESPPIIASRRS